MTHSELTTAIAAYTNATEETRISTLVDLCKAYQARITHLIEKETELRGKPQFMIGSDDEYQEQLERQWARKEIEEEYLGLISEHQEYLGKLVELQKATPAPLSNTIYKSGNDYFFPTNKRVEREYENGCIGDQLWLQMTDKGVIVSNYYTEFEIQNLSGPLTTITLP